MTFTLRRRPCHSIPEMFDWKSNLTADLGGTPWAGTLPTLLNRSSRALSPERHGRLREWQQAVEALPDALPGWQVKNGVVVAGNDAPPRSLKETLMRLHPWRKGPFQLGGIFIDTEWRSDWKWQRIQPHIELAGQTVLDVGAGNGYFGWRMLEAGALRVIACDPTLVFAMQHLAVCHFAGPAPNHLLPLRLEDLPEDLGGFDTVFSMGVLYHRRGHIDHLGDLKRRLKPGGCLVLETLILPGEHDAVLHPPDRYANMRNVHALPTLPVLLDWLGHAGFANARCVDRSWTTTDEQRQTEWMPFHSLKQALSEDGRTTIEGHPPLLRAMVIARSEG